MRHFVSTNRYFATATVVQKSQVWTKALRATGAYFTLKLQRLIPPGDVVASLAADTRRGARVPLRTERGRAQ